MEAGARDGNWTRTICLEGKGSTIELRVRINGEILTKPFARTLPSHSPRYSKPLLNLLTGTMVRSLGLYEIATFKTNEFHHYPYNFNSWERPSFAVIA